MKRKKIPFELKAAGGLSMPFFTKDDKINVEETKRYVEWLVEQECHTIVPASTCSWLSFDEKRVLWEAYADAAKNRMAVMPWPGGRATTTKEFVEEVKMAEEVGANSLYFAIMPVAAVNLSSPTWKTGMQSQESMRWPKDFEEVAYEFFKAGFEATSLPCLIYNCAMGPNAPCIPVDFLVRLANDFENFSGMKTNTSASWSAPFGQLPYEIRALKPLGINIAKGHTEREFVAALVHGCDGFVAPVGHAFPDKLNALYDAFVAGDLKKAVEINNDFLDIVDILLSGYYWGAKWYFVEALGFETGIYTPGVAGKIRHPQLPMPEHLRKKVDRILQEWGVYKKYTYHKS